MMASEAEAPPLLLVVAGPNGAGKSTFFDLFLRETGLRFVNADLIARAIAPKAPHEVGYQAAAAAEIERRALMERRESFCMETVFSDPQGKKVQLLRDAQAAGYRVHLIFIGLVSVELSEARVVQRVLVGGHDVPGEKLVARFPRTLANAEAAREFADGLDVYDNSDAEHPYRLLGRVQRGRVVERSPPLPAWAARLLLS
jgi:predicted ABC-type ATPase